MDYFGRLFGARIVANLSAVIPITQQDLGRSFTQAGFSPDSTNRSFIIFLPY
ncbi:hypothetical protein OC498_05425 [Acinetobacter bohemicus]|uniref:hypothetical protein n=1 Tax=Acinetobacter TaxID=469 RepID=UPI00209B5F31|nr:MULTISPECIES: hypothetical protein [Acinetobacter]MCO8042141.1 hypothetical protein [Acinetobacter sp. S4400-12]MCU7224347.1 hypothetical protein [Acinetobacter bohemicus]